MTRTLAFSLAALLIVGGASAMADVPPLVGDTNLDLVVDIDDLNNVRNNFGARSVPEPSTALLAVLGAVLACSGIRRRRA